MVKIIDNKVVDEMNLVIGSRYTKLLKYQRRYSFIES
jgi:hypothetical protein